MQSMKHAALTGDQWAELRRGRDGLRTCRPNALQERQGVGRMFPPEDAQPHGEQLDWPVVPQPRGQTPEHPVRARCISRHIEVVQCSIAWPSECPKHGLHNGRMAVMRVLRCWRRRSFTMWSRWSGNRAPRSSGVSRLPTRKARMPAVLIMGLDGAGLPSRGPGGYELCHVGSCDYETQVLRQAIAHEERPDEPQAVVRRLLVEGLELV